MYCILIDAHLSDGDRLATLDVFPLMGIDLFNRLYAELHVIFFTHGIRIRPNAWRGIFHREFSLFFCDLVRSRFAT